MPEQEVGLHEPRASDTAFAGGTHLPPHVTRIRTRHADEHRAWINARFGDHERRVRPGARGFEVCTESCRLGGLTIGHSSYTGATVEVSWPPVPHVIVGILRSGKFLIRCAAGEVRLAERGSLLFPSDGYDHRLDGGEATFLSLSMDTVLRVAGESTGLEPAQVRFVGLRPVSPTAERQWQATAHYIHHGVYTRVLDSPLVLAAAEQLTAASLLATFPNTTSTAELRLRRDPATPATVRRALAYIDARADEPITLTDIAAASRVVPRTLQYAFRRHRDTTPLAYLRSVRLARAHQDLLAAEPGDGTTVAAVAARWGFASPHQFAAAYHRVYDQPPARTLRA